MRSLGMYMAIFGAGSILLNFLDRQFIILMWIDNWGPTVAWVIRIALIVIGLGLMFLMPGDEEEAPAE